MHDLDFGSLVALQGDLWHAHSSAHYFTLLCSTGSVNFSSSDFLHIIFLNDFETKKTKTTKTKIIGLLYRRSLTKVEREREKPQMFEKGQSKGVDLIV